MNKKTIYKNIVPAVEKTGGALKIETEETVFAECVRGEWKFGMAKGSGWKKT